MSWPKKSLGEIFLPSGNTRAGDKIYPVLSITMKYGLVDQSDKFKKRIASKDASKYRVASKNELVVGFPVDEGVLGFQTKYPAGIVSPAYNVWKLKREDEVHIPYLEIFLRSPMARHLYASKMQGAVARRRSLSKKDFLALEIPFPDKKNQIKITLLLTKVADLISQRKHQLQQVSELYKSVFFHCFGDPVENDKAFNTKPLGKLLSNIDSGWSPKCESIPANSEQWGVLKLGAVTYGAYRQEENKAMLPNVEPKIKHEVKAGDLLFTRKNTHELVAATAYVHETRDKLLLPDLIFRLVIKDKNEIHPIYLWKLLAYPSQRKKIQSLANGAAGSMPNISKVNLKTVSLPVPDIELQHKFVGIVHKLEMIKTNFEGTLNDLELLYGSLSQRAFNGELDLRAVQLPIGIGSDTDEQVKRSDERLEISQLQSKIERATKQINNPLEQIKRVIRPIELLTKSAEQITKHTKPLSLTNSMPDFSKDKIRQKWLVKLLKEHVSEVDVHSLLSLPEFWVFAQNWIGDFESEEGESYSFSIEDYEVLKDFVFNEIRNDLLIQGYEEASNSIKFKVNKK